MTTNLIAKEVICPLVVSASNPREATSFLGTAFMVSPDRFLTARHCLDGVKLKEDEHLAIVFKVDGMSTCFPIQDVVFDDDYDIAHGTVVGRPEPLNFLTITANDEIVSNFSVITLEYSDTQLNIDNGQGKPVMMFTGYVWKGNIVRHSPTSLGHKKETLCLDLSYPTLVGASGAPVIFENGGNVAGLIVGNTGRHLMPAHVEMVNGRDGTQETISYFLPLGQAIHAKYLRPHVA